MVDYGVFTTTKSISAKRRSDTDIDNTFTAAKQWVTVRQRNATTLISTIQ